MVKSYKNRPTSVTAPLSDRAFKDLDLHNLSGAKLLAADCHASLLEHLLPEDFVFNVDFHLDTDPLDETGDLLNCANWASVALQELNIDLAMAEGWEPNPHTGKPTKRRRLPVPNRPYDLVFLCLSRPYTPPVWDMHFYRFVDELRVLTGSEPAWVGPGGDGLCRLWTDSPR
jgi:hypothetical protein